MSVEIQVKRRKLGAECGTTGRAVNRFRSARSRYRGCLDKLLMKAGDVNSQKMLTSDELQVLVEGLAGLPYGGEAVDQRQHALQCADHAVAAGADDELVLAAALHDVGRAEPVRAEFPGLPHEAAGEAFARDRVGEGVGWLIGQHVPAKRYLVAVDEAYFGTLSPASVRSLEKQGGPMTASEVEQFRSHPRWEDAVALRQWDEAAKDTDAPGLPMTELLRIFDRYRTARP